jgi:hypothetical protein
VSKRSETRIGWHPLDPVSLVAGLLAVVVALGHLLDVRVANPGAVVAVALLAAGAVGLAVTVRRSRRTDDLV